MITVPLTWHSQLAQSVFCRVVVGVNIHSAYMHDPSTVTAACAPHRTNHINPSRWRSLHGPGLGVRCVLCVATVRWRWSQYLSQADNQSSVVLTLCIISRGSPAPEPPNASMPLRAHVPALGSCGRCGGGVGCSHHALCFPCPVSLPSQCWQPLSHEPPGSDPCNHGATSCHLPSIKQWR